MKKNRLRVFIVMIGLMLLSACGQGAQPKENVAKEQELKIVTTFFPMYDFTRNVVGHERGIELLIDGSIEPHDFEPSAKDIAKIQDADVFIYNSAEMETWVPAVLDSIDTSKLKVIEASAGIELLAGTPHIHDHGHDDEEGTHAEGDDHEHDHDHSGLHLHGVADHYHSNDEVTVEAHGFSEYDVVTFEWSLKVGDAPAVKLTDQKEATVSFTLEEKSQLMLKLVNERGDVVAELKPVTLKIDNHEDDHSDHDHHHEHDPHVWLNPLLVKREVAMIETGLSEVKPSKKSTYQKNSHSYQEKLDQLDNAFETAFSGAKNRIFVTQHTAFAYLAERYQLEQLGISGVSPDMEPTAKNLAEIETFVKAN